ncbi:MAG TPA: rRNA maturation RNase YbeY [Sphingomicrobium sp.]|nr:rRNA maturation RNase YbeY [Sphingomicrobium sp.]
MTLDIELESDGEWDSSTDWQKLVRTAAEAAIRKSAFPQLAESPRRVELSVRLTGDEEVRALNAEWRRKDKPTNVLSFPMAERYELELSDEEGPDLLLGDVVLARGVCAREADAKHIPLESHAAHLVVHGTLHLLGYDHDGEAEAADMELREVEALAALGIPDPYGERG